MNIIPTEEQILCEEAARRGSASLLVNALAGAAKTTTLVRMASAMPVAPTICVAFNKRIAIEMGTRMPGHVNCATLNSVGHRVWASSIGKRLIVNTDKSYSILSELTGAMSQKDRKEKLGDTFASVLKAVRFCKSAGYVPESMTKFGQGLTTLEDMLEVFARQVDVDPDDEFLSLVDKVLETSISEAYQGRIDFDDQIYMSTLFGGAYPRYPVVMVDEAQDLSPLNHKSLEKMYAGRLIAVGDPHQAIYGFRGASHSSMSELKAKFNMQELALSTSFRCPKSVVQNALWRVPHMRYPDWAKPGAVTHLNSWTEKDIPDGAAIICRNNAPIFSVAMRLIKRGRGVKILGNDVGAGLVKILEKLGPGDMDQAQTLLAIGSWEETQERKAHKARLASIRDKAECLRVFASAARTLDEAIAYAKAIFSASGPIQLMTGHKSKGGEWPVVFHLDSFLVPSKWALRAAEAGDEGQLEQENNLKYVIETRSLESLIFINSEDYQ